MSGTCTLEHRWAQVPGGQRLSNEDLVQAPDWEEGWLRHALMQGPWSCRTNRVRRNRFRVQKWAQTGLTHQREDIWRGRTRTVLAASSAGPVSPAVLLQAQLQLMQVHWGRVYAGPLQVQTVPLTPQPPEHKDSETLRQDNLDLCSPGLKTKYLDSNSQIYRKQEN